MLIVQLKLADVSLMLTMFLLKMIHESLKTVLPNKR